MIAYYRIVAATLMLMVAVTSAAKDETSRYFLKKSVEEHIEKLVKTYDATAVVVIELKSPVESVPLPLTPLVMDLKISDRPAHRSGVVHIFSEINQLPAREMKLIKEMMRSLAVQTTFEYHEPSETQGLKKDPDAISEGVEKLLQSESFRRVNALISEIQENRKAIIFVISALLLLVIAGPIFVSIAILLSMASRRTSLLQNTQKLISVIESKELGQSTGPAKPPVTSQEEARVTSSAMPQQTPTQGLSQTGITALLTDCYWCHLDAQAAYIWKNLSAEMRQSIYSEDLLLRKYVKYLSSKTAVANNYADDPYYLNPLSINHLDNADLLAFVRSAPVHFDSLSLMRSEHLALTPSERLGLIQIASLTTAPDSLKDLSALPVSAPRNLKSGTRIIPKSVADDLSLREYPDLNTSLASRIPSLIWLARLQPEQLKSLLKDIPARNLAEAWDGPSDILALMEAALPASKLKLLTQLREKTTPSRQSASYLTLWQASVALLEKPQATHDDEAVTSDDLLAS